MLHSWERLVLLTALLWATAPATTRGDSVDDAIEYTRELRVDPPHISSDRSIKYDYDIVYVRAARAGDEVHKRFYTDIAAPVYLEPGADLMLLHPDGTEELLVAGGKGSVTDPVISYDGEWVFYTLIYNLEGAGQWQAPHDGADIFKLHLPTRKIVRLTSQQFTPNSGAADWASDHRSGYQTHLSYGVLNFGAYPLPGGRVVFTSNRNAYRPSRGYPPVALQLFVMDDDGSNVEQIGYLNLAGALHPVVLTDGRIIFSSLESQGVRNNILWGIWSIHPDGTNWGPVVSAFDPGNAPNAFHFQSQLSDGSIVVEEYYNQNNSGFGAYIKLPLKPREGYPAFGPALMSDARNTPLRFGRFDNGKGKFYRMPFMPAGAISLTPFALNGEGPADTSVRDNPGSPKVGKFTHPSGAPDNHLLTIWSPGPVNHQYKHLPQLDGGIYLLKGGRPVEEPGQLLLIKNDPQYNEQWPRAVVPYRRIYGIDEPRRIEPLANDGRLSPHLPAGTPFGLVGSSSLYKRESYPNGVVREGRVTAGWAGGYDFTNGFEGLDPFNTSQNGASLNWFNQGADAGRYSNDDIHAIRIVALEPTTDRNRGPKSGRLFHNHATERMRILGEIPVRKFAGGAQPVDPDGNPDTSFLARIPADTAFTFQTIDKDGMVLNMAQTWHQLRPGEIRHDCGGCHAHSQQPTPFGETAAAKSDYRVFDLTGKVPLVTAREGDESGRIWDAAGETGLRYAAGGATVEFHRDVLPIFRRSCVACHTTPADGSMPPGKLVLDDMSPVEVPNVGPFPNAYYRLALDQPARFGYKPLIINGEWRNHCASRYVRMFQSRRSLLTWKIYGRRTDGWTNDDFPSETKPGDRNSLAWHGQPLEPTQNNCDRSDLDCTGSPMPPAEAVTGTWVGPDGRKIKVEPLTDEDRRTIVRWIDLGCPIDLDYDPAAPDKRGFGWMCDDNRPTLAVTRPRAGRNAVLDRVLVGMHDFYTGLGQESFEVVADFAVDGKAPGTNLAPQFASRGDNVWELVLREPIKHLGHGRLTVAVRDRQGNTSRIERTISVAALPDPAPANPERDDTEWIEAMTKVHARFKGKRGTFAHFGDSITISMAFWAPLRGAPKGLSPAAARTHERVKKYMLADCWAGWKGPEYGNNGSMTIRWAHDNIDEWLKRLDPEVALIMFGSNDLGPLELDEYVQKTREVVRKCLANGTIVILNTPPPRTGLLDKSREFAQAVAKLAREEKVPVVDYFSEILRRRPDDWDGTLDKFKGTQGDEYQVPTLISRDGVHPSNPRQYGDFSDEALRNNGFALRSYLVLLAYGQIIDRVLDPPAPAGATAQPKVKARRGTVRATAERPPRFPHRIWAACDFESRTPDYGWFGPPETKNIPRYPGNATALGVGERPYGEFSALMTGINPVPGPRMGKVNQLYLRYFLKGTTEATFQHFSLTREDNNHIHVTGLTEGKWSELTLNFTRDAVRNDGSEEPFAEGERMDDFKVFVGKPGDGREYELYLDDVLFFSEDPDPRVTNREPFPNRVIYLAAFDTGPKDKYWPGEFEIVEKGLPAESYWRVARAVPRKDGKGMWIRLQIDPPRPVGAHTKLRFRCHLSGASTLTAQIFDATDQDNRHVVLRDLKTGEWTTQTVDFTRDGRRNDGSNTPFGSGHLVDDLFFFVNSEGDQPAELLIDEVVLFDAGPES